MSQRDVFGAQVPTYVLPSTLGAPGEVLTVGPKATPNVLVWTPGAGASPPPGFELIKKGTMTFTGTQVDDITANYALYYSGTAPDQIATLQIETSTTGVVGATPLSASFTSPLPLVGVVPKFSQGGSALLISPGFSFYSFIYIMDNTALTLSLDIIAPPYPLTGYPLGLYGMSLTFPIA